MAKAQSSLSLSNDSILHTFDCAGHEATLHTVFMLRRMIVVVLTELLLLFAAPLH